MENKVKLGVGLIVIVLLVNALVSYQAARTLARNDQWVRHTYEVLTELEVILSTVKDAETGERGYIITGLETYLDPYQSALSQIDRHIQNLRELTVDNPGQQARIPQLQSRIAKRLASLKEGIDMRRSGEVEGVNRLVASGAGKRLMEDIRQFISDMEADENQLLTQRLQESRINQRDTILTFVFANLIACAILLSTATIIIRGIRARRRAEDERSRLLLEAENARRTAEAASRAKDEFLAVISHELRTPLTAVFGWIHVLQGNTVEERTREKALAVIERNLRAQTHLIDDLLDISQIVRGKLRIRPTPTDPLQIVQGTIETIRSSAEAKRIQIQLEAEEKLPAISADPARLQQIVWNLLSNAVKFTPKNGTIVVRIGQVESKLQIEVSDTGQGIPKEFLPEVFERFTQADTSSTRSHGGFGLGLALVKQLVELHGGTVMAESIGPGQGSTFTIKLPLTEVTSAA